MAIFIYYGYLKINKGITFEQFLDEDAEVVNSLINLKSIEQEIRNKNNGK